MFSPIADASQWLRVQKMHKPIEHVQNSYRRKESVTKFCVLPFPFSVCFNSEKSLECVLVWNRIHVTMQIEYKKKVQ